MKEQKGRSAAGDLPVIRPREADIGGMIVRRSLPNRETRSVGPWVFFDHMGPATLPAGQGLDVVPHPHINLATVTYLFAGEIVHRDSIGSLQSITPGAINLMVAGSGIAHSERTPEHLRAVESPAHGLQLWLALPDAAEETPPEFLHYPAWDLPGRSENGIAVRVLIGEAFGLTSPVKTYSPTLYAEMSLKAGCELRVPIETPESAVYLVEGQATIGDVRLGDPSMVVLPAERPVVINAGTDARVVLIGGEPVGPRYMWWNFVSSRRQRIEKARSDWENRAFAPIPDDDEERAELPEADSHSLMKE